MIRIVELEKIKDEFDILQYKEVNMREQIDELKEKNLKIQDQLDLLRGSC